MRLSKGRLRQIINEVASQGLKDKYTKELRDHLLAARQNILDLAELAEDKGKAEAQGTQLADYITKLVKAMNSNQFAALMSNTFANVRKRD